MIDKNSWKKQAGGGGAKVKLNCGKIVSLPSLQLQKLQSSPIVPNFTNLLTFHERNGMNDSRLTQSIDNLVHNILKNPKNLATEVELLEQAKVAVNLFLEYDTDSSGVLSFEELKFLCDHMGLPVEKEDEDRLVSMDTDGSGSLSMNNWVLWWLQRVSTLPNPLKQQEAIAMNTFLKFDKDQSGYLNIDELANLLSVLGAELTDTELKQALEEIDEDGSGKVEAAEFVAWWTQRASNNRKNCSLLSLKLKMLASKAAQIFFTDIFTAAWKGDLNLVKSFIQGDKRLVDASDRVEDGGGGWSPLHYASYQGHADIVTELLAAGAKVNSINDMGFTSLFYAAQRGHIDICRQLMAKGADPSIAGSDPSVDSTTVLCPVDFLLDYPQLRELFEGHHRCAEPKKIPSYKVEATLAATGILSVTIKVDARDYSAQISTLPLRKYEFILSYSSTKPRTEDDEYSDFEDEAQEGRGPSPSGPALSFSSPASAPSQDQSCEVPIDKNWFHNLLEQVQSEDQSFPPVTLQLAGRHSLSRGPFSEAVEVNCAELSTKRKQQLIQRKVDLQKKREEQLLKEKEAKIDKAQEAASRKAALAKASPMKSQKKSEGSASTPGAKGMPPPSSQTPSIAPPKRMDDSKPTSKADRSMKS